MNEPTKKAKKSRRYSIYSYLKNKKTSIVPILLICLDCQESKNLCVVKRPLIIDCCNHCQKIKPCYEVDFGETIARSIKAHEARPRTMPSSLFARYCPHCRKNVVPRCTTGGVIVKVCPVCGRLIRPAVFRSPHLGSASLV